MVNESSLDLQLILDVLRKDDSKCSLSWEKPELFELDARNFLSFAELDLTDDSDRGRVNALSNAKRAIQCRIDELLTLFNFRRFSSSKGWKMPYKMQVLESFDFPAPSVLRNLITSRRNLLEHEYIKPKDHQEIQNVVDVAALFLRATEQPVQAGYVATAKIECVRTRGKETGEIRKGDIYGKRTRNWINWSDVKDLIEISFDLENNSITLTRSEYEERVAQSQTTGEMVW